MRTRQVITNFNASPKVTCLNVRNNILEHLTGLQNTFLEYEEEFNFGQQSFLMNKVCCPKKQ